MAVNLIRKNGTDQVTAAMDAAMYYCMFGNGIIDGVRGSCLPTYQNDVLTINSGFIMFGGRLVEIPLNNPVTLSFTNYKSVLTYVKLGINISSSDTASTASVYLSTDSTESSVQAILDDGFYTMNLFSRAADGTLTVLASLITPGIAKYANNLLLTGYLGDSLTTDVFSVTDNKVNGAKYAHVADEATYAYGFQGDTDEEIELNEVANNLYMPNRDVFLMTDSVLAYDASVLASSMSTTDPTSVSINTTGLASQIGPAYIRLQERHLGTIELSADMLYNEREYQDEDKGLRLGFDIPHSKLNILYSTIPSYDDGYGIKDLKVEVFGYGGVN